MIAEDLKQAGTQQLLQWGVENIREHWSQLSTQWLRVDGVTQFSPGALRGFSLFSIPFTYTKKVMAGGVRKGSLEKAWKGVKTVWRGVSGGVGEGFKTAWLSIKVAVELSKPVCYAGGQQEGFRLVICYLPKSFPRRGRVIGWELLLKFLRVQRLCTSQIPAKPVPGLHTTTHTIIVKCKPRQYTVAENKH